MEGGMAAPLPSSMNEPPFDIPTTSALLAFEAVVRLDSISPAAEERHTSQSAISRHIRALGQALLPPDAAPRAPAYG